MSTTVTAPAPRVKRTVTEESFVSPADKPKWFAFPDEFVEFIAGSSETELQKYIIYVYRLKDRESRNAEGSYIDKLIPTKDFDESYLKSKAGADGQGFGGGFFKIILKDAAGQRRSQGVWEIAGQPRDPGAPGAAMTMPTMPGVDGQSAVTMEALKMAGNPQMMTVIMQLMMTASGHAMAMIREAMPKQPDFLQLIQLMKELQPAPAAPPPLDEFAQMQRTLMLKLLERSIEPGDPLASIKSVGGILEAVKQFSGSNVKADWSSTLLATLPTIGEKIVSGLHEQRLSNEAQERTLAMQRNMNPNDPRVITIPGEGAPPAQAPPPPAASAAGPQVVQPGSNAWYAIKIEAGILDPKATGTDLYNWIAACHESGLLNDAGFEALTSSAESAVATVQNLFNEVWGPENDHLKTLLALPRLRDFITEYIAAAALDRANVIEPPAPPAPKPN